MLRTSTCLLILFTMLPNAQAKNKLACRDPIDLGIDEIALDELIDAPLFISASQQAACTKEAANIVNVITGKQILNSGARDLIDVLHLVPGFNFGVNMSNEVGLGIRGIQADEGKMSVFVDGVMLTEQRFGTTAFGAHFPIEQIDRIEIIRGPSSIQNGNFAEVGVINIITKNAAQLNGAIVTTTYGHYQRGEARKTINLAAGHAWQDWEVTFSGKAGEAQRSDRIYRDAHGNTFDMAENSDLNSLYGNLMLRYKELKLRFVADEYAVEGRDGFADSVLDPSEFLRNKFTTYATHLDFNHEFDSNLKLDVSFQHSQQTPWERYTHYTDGRPRSLDESVTVDSYKWDGKLTFMDDSGSYLTLGNSYKMDDYHHNVSDFSGTLPIFTDYTAYLEGVYKTSWVDILAGLRFDNYNQFGTNLAPRVALTKEIEKFHYKLIYTHAFHVPTGGQYQMNLEYNQTNKLGRTIAQLEPEIAYTYELELGYQFYKNLQLTGNLFYTQIKDIFTYTFDENYDDYYINARALDTYGLEMLLQYQNKTLGRFDLGYSFYQSVRNTIPSYYQAVDASGQIVHDTMNIGFPTHKATLNHFVELTPSLSFNHNFVFYSDRYGYSGSNLVYHRPVWFYNVYFRYKNFIEDGLELGLGLYDMFNARYEYVQQFNGGHPALPGPSRELMLKVSYQF